MRVTMIGAGYVGLVSGACFADFGHQVTCIDKDAAKIEALNRGEIPIFEPGLADLVEANMRQGRLEFAGETSRIGEAEAVFIAVGTPSRRGDGHADLTFVYEAVREIAPLLSPAAVVVTKSTVPVGTGDEIERILREKRPDADDPGRLQSGIPARRRRDSGFQASRSHRGRHRRCARPRRARRNLPAALSERRRRSSMSAGAPPN